MQIGADRQTGFRERTARQHSRRLPVSADPIADFYKGKTISLIISSAEGGGYDIAGRVVTEYLSRHIPGNPTVIARNMPGASGMRAADYMFNVAARDGTVISIPQPTMLLNKVVDPSARYEPQGFAWIGRLAALEDLWRGLAHGAGAVRRARQDAGTDHGCRPRARVQAPTS